MLIGNMTPGRESPMTIRTTRRRRSYNPSCRDKCRSRVLVDEGATWAVWMCTSCDRRYSEGEPQLGLFARLDVVPRQPEGEDQEDEPA